MGRLEPIPVLMAPGRCSPASTAAHIQFPAKHCVRSSEEDTQQRPSAAQSWSSVLCMLGILGEAALPRSAVLAGAKSAAVLIQGVWLIMIANIMWTGATCERSAINKGCLRHLVIRTDISSGVTCSH